MKLVASVIVRNELGRYLEPCLGHLLEFCDEIRVLDNCSDDDWRTHLGGHGLKVLRYPDESLQEHSHFVGHAQARQRLLEWTLEGEPTHVLAIDADEFITDGQAVRRVCEQQPANEAWHVCMQEVWNAEPDRLELRQDGGWAEHDIAMLWRPELVRQPLQIVDRGPATGRTPATVGLGYLGHTCSSVLHMGWANRSERQARYDRYRVADGGRFHASQHLESIMWPDERIRMSSREWPVEVGPWRDQILARAGDRVAA